MNPDLEGLEEFAEPNVGRVVPNVAAAVVMPLNGGIQNGTPWTGGSRDPARQRDTPLTPLCSRSEQIGHRVWNRCERGVEDEWKIKLSQTQARNLMSHFHAGRYPILLAPNGGAWGQ